MNDEPIDLDKRRGMMAQKDTELRRRLSEVKANQHELKMRQDEFEEFLDSIPATTQQEAVTRAKYVIQLYAVTSDGADPRRARLIQRTLEELDRLFNLTSPAANV